jgi:CDP-4-dehydro-6-deoxyglucose reductase
LPVITLLNQKQFTTAASETLLEAALRTNITLEHSCKTGRCGTCRAEVVSGSTEACIDEVALTATERASGWILTCARYAVDDVRLSVEDLGDEKLVPARTFPCRIHSLEKLAPDVMKVVLRLPPRQTLEYRAGQYIDVIGSNAVRRSYSLANAPGTDSMLELHVREVPGGAMSRFWFGDAKSNDLLRLHGPLGTFFLRGASDDHLIFLATGTGMAPIKAMLEGLDHRRAALNPSVYVFWGGRTERDLYWEPVRAGHACDYTPVLSRAGADWDGARGYVQDAVLAKGLDLGRARVYACGSPAMIDSARNLLLSHGLESHRFHSDAFVCSS